MTMTERPPLFRCRLGSVVPVSVVLFAMQPPYTCFVPANQFSFELLSSGRVPPVPPAYLRQTS